MTKPLGDLEQAVQMVFESKTHTETIRCGEAVPAFGDELVGVIYLAGVWRGAVALHLPRAVATPIAAEMLGLSLGEVGERELRLAACELTSQLGENLKRTFDGPIALSLPTLQEAGTGSLASSSASQGCVFLSPYGEFGVCVHS